MQIDKNNEASKINKLDKMVQPLVSVILPVYNRYTVVRTIQSILNQTYTHFELLVIDNASTDGTATAIQRIQDARIRLIQNEANMGQTFSINRGLKEAKGKYIARIDSDDIAFPKRLEKQVRFLEGHPAYVLCGSWVQFLSDDGKLGFIVKTCTTDKGLRFMQTLACGMYHPSAMYRKSTIDKYHIQYQSGLSMAEDYDMWARLLEHGKGLNLAEPLLYYRRGAYNDSRIHRKTMGTESFQIRKRICSGIKMEETKKQALLQEIALEEKEDKNILESLKVALFLYRYLRNSIPRQSPDYRILKQHVALRVYSSCFAVNRRFYARVLSGIYHWLKSHKRQ